MPNCVGYANGRFNEIIGQTPFAYQFISDAFKFIDIARSKKLLIGSIPQLGAIAVWKDLNYPNSRGHVAIVEHIYSVNHILTSESGYGNRAIWWTVERYSYNGNWSSASNLVFLGFIYNPAVPCDAVPGLLANYNYYDGGAVNIPDSEYISSQSSLLYKTQNV